MSIVPVDVGIGTKIMAFMHLTFIKGVPFSQTKRIFVSDKMTSDEKTVLSITRRSVFTAAELIQYFQDNRVSVNNDETSNTESKTGNAAYIGTDYHILFHAFKVLEQVYYRRVWLL